MFYAVHIQPPGCVICSRYALKLYACMHTPCKWHTFNVTLFQTQMLRRMWMPRTAINNSCSICTGQHILCYAFTCTLLYTQVQLRPPSYVDAPHSPAHKQRLQYCTGQHLLCNAFTCTLLCTQMLRSNRSYVDAPHSPAPD